MTTRNWDEIEKTLQEDPDHEAMLAKAKAEVAAEEEAYFRALAHVRQARDMTQEELAEVLGIKQTSASKVERSHEHHADLYVSTLRRFIEAMGGELLITAVFDDVEVPIDNFREIDTTNPEPKKIPTRRSPKSRSLKQAI